MTTTTPRRHPPPVVARRNANPNPNSDAQPDRIEMPLASCEAAGHRYSYAEIPRRDLRERPKTRAGRGGGFFGSAISG